MEGNHSTMQLVCGQRDYVLYSARLEHVEMEQCNPEPGIGRNTCRGILLMLCRNVSRENETRYIVAFIILDVAHFGLKPHFLTCSEMAAPTIAPIEERGPSSEG